jgi:hypothetical protein
MNEVARLFFEIPTSVLEAQATSKNDAKIQMIIDFILNKTLAFSFG